MEAGEVALIKLSTIIVGSPNSDTRSSKVKSERFVAKSESFLWKSFKKDFFCGKIKRNELSLRESSFCEAQKQAYF